MRSILLAGASSVAMALGICVASAQAAETSADVAELTEVIVTGSHIAGTPQDSSLPVSVISSQVLEKQGSPSLVNIVKTLPGAYASYGESNRLLGNVGGYATLNLRGFGGARTLVLMNGQRLAPSAPDGGQDINLIPTAAIGRIEILKGGAAANYGSDAVAGVVNFITRRDLDGLELNGDYSFISNGGGDYNLTAAYGWKWDSGDALVSAGYRRRTQVRLRDVGFGYVPGQAGFDTARGAGGWSGASNPGTYLVLNATQLATGVLPSSALAGTTNPTGAIVDDGCLELGGALSGGTCRFHYSAYDNLVNDEYHYQLHGQLNVRLTDDIDFHMEGSFARHTVPEEPFSPTQGTSNFPSPVAASGGSLGGGATPFPARTGTLNTKSFYYIPFSNPGLTQYFNTHCVGVPAAPAYCANLPNGVVTSPTGWRAAAYGGNPNYDDGANHQKAMATGYRFAASLTGKFSDDINWSIGANAHQVRALDVLPDLLVNRLEFALRGLGGPGCNPATGTPGVGPCQYFNPFSNGIAVSKVNDAPNPFYLGGTNAALRNDPALFAWMMGQRVAEYTTTVATIDPVVNGELPFELPGGRVAFAVGGQLRYNHAQRVMNTQGDLAANPCVDSIDDGSPTCVNGTGPYIFYPGLSNYDIEQSVKAVFGELRLPIFDTLTASAAIRYEDYGDGLTSTAPKFDVKWQALEWVAFRASAGKTLRAPSPLSVTPGFARTLASFTNPVNSTALYRSVDVQNNPDLKPESARAYDVGIIVQTDNFQATLDYYRFKFKDELTSQQAANFFSTMFPSATPSTWRCSNATLLAHFDFVSDVCDPGNLLLVRTSLINGPKVDTSGLDFQASYTIDNPLGRDAELVIGGDATRLLEYKRGAVVSEGITIAPALDRAGLAELLGAFYSYPKWRGNLYANYAEGGHNFRATLRYTGGERDLNAARAKIKPYYQLDLIYRAELPWDAVATLGVVNVFDRNPPRAVSQYNYDYTIGNPLGRVFQVGVKKTF